MIKELFILLFLLSPVIAQAACTTQNTGFDANGVTVTYKCDTEAEFPTSGLNVGDRIVALDTGKEAFATSSTDFGISSMPLYSSPSSSNIGIGTRNPDSNLTVTAQGNSYAPISGTTVHFTGVDANPLRLTYDTHNSASSFGSALFGRRSRGTATNPSAVLNNDTLLQLAGYGYGATGYVSVSKGTLALATSQDWTDAAQGTYWRFFTTPNDGTSQTERMMIAHNGNVGIGTTSPQGVLQVVGNVDATSINGLTITEAGLESLIELQDLQGAVTDAQVPNDITITETDSAHDNCSEITGCVVGALSAEVDGSTSNEIEVVDEAYTSGNFNGATAQAVSQDDFYDLIHISDTDDDGLPNALDTAPTIGAATGTSFVATGAITSSGTAGIGYSTGAGGTVTQATSKTTGVTLNKTSGQITMNGAALAAAAEVAFTLTNSTIAATDVVIVNVQSVGTAGADFVTVGAVAAGSCSITVGNASAGSLSQAIVLNFSVIKGVSS